MSANEIFDIAVIGGGINGAGIAADAAGRGLKVCLFEKSDLASATSSASSKLIHGGLRYLEHFEFSLVRDALQERERLLKAAPHIISPLRIVLPHVDGMRARWLLRAGLFLYDHLARRETLPASQTIRFSTDPSGVPLNADLTRGFAYWDCWVDDARLVILNARAAVQKGAKIKTRTRVLNYQPARDTPRIWKITAASERGDVSILARVVVNAAGPWVDDVAGLERGPAGTRTAQKGNKLRLVKGSHLVVPRQPGVNDGYLLQNRDGRVVFALPYQDQFTLLGTTDEPYDGDPETAACSGNERDYLLKVYNRFFAKRLVPDDVVQDFSGVRPLYDDAEEDPSKVTRDYRLDFRPQEGSRPPLLTVLGGKLTTYRRLSEEALDLLAVHFPKAGPAWTANHPLPGGAFQAGRSDLMRRLVDHYPNLDTTFLSTLVSRYGVSTYDLLGDAQKSSDLGQELLPHFHEREILYLRDIEWAKTAEDILWRRTKTGLGIRPGELASVTEAIENCLIQS